MLQEKSACNRQLKGEFIKGFVYLLYLLYLQVVVLLYGNLGWEEIRAMKTRRVIRLPDRYSTADLQIFTR